MRAQIYNLCVIMYDGKRVFYRIFRVISAIFFFGCA